MKFEEELLRYSIIITGATGGIGKQITNRLAQKGFSLVLVGRDKNILQKMALEQDSVYLVQDLSLLSSAESCNDFFDQCKQKARKPIFGFIHCAASCTYGRFSKTSVLEDFSDCMVTEIFPRLFAKLIANYLLVEGQIGFAVSIGSIAGLAESGPNFANYYACKAGMLSYFNSLHRELKEFGIEISSVCPGIVDTPFHEHASIAETKLKKAAGLLLSTPEKVAEATVRHVFQKKPSAMYFPTWGDKLTYWAYHTCPTLFNLFIRKFLKKL